MLALYLLAATAATACFAAERYVGAVVKTEAAPPALLVQLDAGGQKWIAVAVDTAVLRVTPGEKDLARAAKLKFEQVQTGDRVLVRADGEPAIAAQVLVLSQTDLARKHEAERDDWKKRGVSGRVTAVDPDTGEIVINTAVRLGSAALLVKTSAQTEQRRYRADSPRFSDARPSAIRDIHPGDQIQALGDRTPDGKAIAAERIVSGAFRNFTATIQEVNAARQELLVKSNGNGPPFLVKIAPGSILRRLSEEAASQLAAKNPRRPDGPGAQNILDGSLVLTAAELRRGDALVIAIVEDPAASDGAGLTAIALIAGVEPLLKRSAESQREVLGSWNLSLDPESPGGER